MSQLNKINRALKIIYKYLPSTYPKIGVKIYKTCCSMIKAEGNRWGDTYKQRSDWYRKYLEEHSNSQKNYINTKYYKPKKTKRRKGCLKLTAIASVPIKINIEYTLYHTLKNYTFLLLHEIGHHYYEPKGQKYNEHLCDTFAIRWFKRIIL